MTLNFRGKSPRDFETHWETIISASSFLNIDSMKRHSPSQPGISRQQETDNSDNTIEYRK